MPEQPVPWRDAWEHALYGDGGFFVTSRPAQHFRTSVHVGLFAEAVAELARRCGARHVHDVGAGGGELLLALRRLLPDVGLTGVELGPRPAGLPDDIGWTRLLPARMDGLVLANEWLDNVPCEVVETDDLGVVRIVDVDPATGTERLGDPCDDEGLAWLERWWPLAEPGQRAEIGLARDAAWADVVRRTHGVAVAIDYGHLREDRPPFGSLRSYREGREVDVVPDGTRDVTAHVAVDAVADRTGSGLLSQRDALTQLGVSGDRPPLGLATSDPAAYVRALSRSGEAGELLARGGLGDFWWLVAGTRGHGTLNA